MDGYTPDFSLEVQGVKGYCPAGEAYANRSISENKIPVLSCEGPCIRGEIARLAANMVAQDLPSYARACHAETFFVPHSSMARWVKQADKSVMIDGCFLKCHGRALKGLVGEGKMIHIDALPLYRKYTDIFLMDDVPEDERKAVAREVADKIVGMLREENPQDGAISASPPWPLRMPIVGLLVRHAISWRMWWRGRVRKHRLANEPAGASVRR
jgi:hypothetical protein